MAPWLVFGAHLQIGVRVLNACQALGTPRLALLLPHA